MVSLTIYSFLLQSNEGQDIMRAFLRFFTEKDFLLRSVEDHYESMQKAAQRQHGDPTNGVRNDCVLINTLQNFHCVTNYNFEVKHDLTERVCQYEVKLVLDRIVYVDKSMNELNQRPNFFSYA